MRRLMMFAAVLLATMTAMGEQGPSEKLATEVFSRARTLEGKGDYREAMSWYQRAYDIRPRSEALWRVAICAVKAGDARKAAEVLAEYVEVNPQLKQDTVVAKAVEDSEFMVSGSGEIKLRSEEMAATVGLAEAIWKAEDREGPMLALPEKTRAGEAKPEEADGDLSMATTGTPRSPEPSGSIPASEEAVVDAIGATQDEASAGPPSGPAPKPKDCAAWGRANPQAFAIAVAVHYLKTEIGLGNPDSMGVRCRQGLPCDCDVRFSPGNRWVHVQWCLLPLPPDPHEVCAQQTRPTQEVICCYTCDTDAKGNLVLTSTGCFF